MKRRTVKKQFWFSRDEAQDLQKKAKKTCLTEAALVRLLVRGYEPKERPDERFYDVMRQLSSIGNNINQLAAQANSLSLSMHRNFRRKPNAGISFRRMWSDNFSAPKRVR